MANYRVQEMVLTKFYSYGWNVECGELQLIRLVRAASVLRSGFSQATESPHFHHGDAATG